MFRADGCRTGPGRVHVHPRPYCGGDLGDTGHRVDGARRGGADRGNHEAWDQAVGDVGVDHPGQGVDVHRVVAVDRHDPQLVAAEAGHQDVLLNRRVGLAGGVHTQVGECLRAPGPVPGGQHGAQRRRRRRVLDDATTRPVGPEPVGEATRLGQPVQYVCLQLGAGRAGGPEHPLHAQAGRHQLPEHGGGRRVGREVAVEPGMLPLGDGRGDEAVHVGQQGIEGLTHRWGRRRQRRPYVPGCHVGHYRPIGHTGQEVGYPVHRRMAGGPELVRGHVVGAAGHLRHHRMGHGSTR